MQLACGITKARIQRDTHIILTASYLFNSIRFCKMLYGNTKTEKIPNDLPAIMICWAKLYVFRRPRANEHYFVSMQYGALIIKTYVLFTVNGYINLSYRKCCAAYFYIGDTDMWLNSTHNINCCVSTTTMVTRTRDTVTLYLHYLHCKKYIKMFVLKPSCGNLGVHERAIAKGS